MKTSLSPFWVGITVIMVTYSFYSCNEMSVVEIQDTNVVTQTQNETEEDIFVGRYAMHYKYTMPNLDGFDPEFIEVDQIDVNFRIHFCTDINEYQITSPLEFQSEGICANGTTALSINHLFSHSDPGISEKRVIGSTYWENDSLHFSVLYKVTNWPPAPTYEYTISGAGIKIE